MRQARIALAVVAVSLLAGCGGSSGNGETGKPPAQIVADAVKAAKSATAVHVHGAGINGTTPLKLDLYLVAGKGGRGHLTANGLSFDLIRVGKRAYFRGDASFWRSFGGNAAATLLKGRWLSAPADKGEFASFEPLTNISKLFTSILRGHGRLTKGDTATVDGQKVVGVVDHAKAGGTLYVATSGKPFPLEVVSPKGQHGTIHFDGWDKPVTLAPPPNPISIEKLKTLAGG